jgi:hypothetical protein
MGGNLVLEAHTVERAALECETTTREMTVIINNK